MQILALLEEFLCDKMKKKIMSKDEKMVLKKTLENKLTVDHKHMTIEKLGKNTDKTEDELYKIINLLLTRGHVKMIDTSCDWTVNPFYITEKGLKALEINLHEIIQNIFIGIATIVAIIALFN